MSWWNAKYKNNYGEYEIAFASKDYEKAKAVEKVCCSVMDKAVKSPFDVEVVVRCRECKYSRLNHLMNRDILSCENIDVCGEEYLFERNPNDFCSYGERKEGQA